LVLPAPGFNAERTDSHGIMVACSSLLWIMVVTRARRATAAPPVLVPGSSCGRGVLMGSGGRARARVCVWRGRDRVGAGRNAHVLARFGIRRELGDPKRSYKDAGTSPLNSQSFAAAIQIFVVDLAVDDASFSLPKSRVWYQTQVK
jgi:hypothetical protein